MTVLASAATDRLLRRSGRACAGELSAAGRLLARGQKCATVLRGERVPSVEPTNGYGDRGLLPG